MSLTKEALQHIEQSHKTGTEVAEGKALILGEQFSLADLEQYQDHRRRFRGKYQTQDLAAFLRYVEIWASSGVPVFIDQDRMAARSFLDIGGQDAPGHCEHSATLTLPKTPDFLAFHGADGATYDQDKMVELIEDWGHLMMFTNAKGEQLEKSKVIHAFRKVSIDDLTSIESEKQEHSSQIGVMNKVTVKQAERLPTVITWTLQPYEGLTERGFDMRVATITKGGPSFRLRAMALEATEKEIAKEFAGDITRTLPECECLLGTFSP